MDQQPKKNVFDPYPALPGETGEEWLDPNGYTEVYIDGQWVPVKRSELAALPKAPPKPPVASLAAPVTNAVAQEGVRQLATEFLPAAASSAAPAAASTGASLAASAPFSWTASTAPAATSAGMDLAASSPFSWSAPTAAGAAEIAPTMLGSTTLGAMLPAAGYAAGAYVGGQQLSGVSDAIKGKDLNFQQQAALALPTFGASFLYNPVKKMFGSGKDKDQLARDSVRKSLLDKGFIDQDYNLSLLNGTKFDIGKDGGDPQYNVDFSRPNAAQAVAWANPLAALITGGDKKLTNDFAGYLANAAYSDDAKTLRDNIANLYQKYGVSPDQIDEFMDNLSAQGVISQQDAAIHKANIDSLTRLNDYGVIGKQPSEPKPSTPAAPPEQTDVQVQQKDPPRQQQQAAPPPPPPPKNLNQIAMAMSQQRSNGRR